MLVYKNTVPLSLKPVSKILWISVGQDGTLTMLQSEKQPKQVPLFSFHYALLASFLAALGIKSHSKNSTINSNNGQLSVPGSNDEEITRDVLISAAHKQKKINVCQVENA